MQQGYFYNEETFMQWAQVTEWFKQGKFLQVISRDEKVLQIWDISPKGGGPKKSGQCNLAIFKFAFDWNDEQWRTERQKFYDKKIFEKKTRVSPFFKLLL